jgi:hypothetical protein
MMQTDMPVKRNMSLKSGTGGLLDFLEFAVAVYESVDGGRAFLFRDCNRTGESIETVKREDLIGRSVLEVFPAIREWFSPV